MRGLISTINDAMLSVYVESMCKASDAAEKTANRVSDRQLSRGVTGIVAGVGAFGLPAGAYAAGNNGCTSQAATNLVNVLANFTNLAILLVSTFAVLAFVIGAGYIVVGGDKGPSKGFKWVKGAVIALGVLAGASFFKYVVLNFIQGATGGSGAGSSATNKCLTKGDSSLK